MADRDHVQLARASYEAYVSDDRTALEELLADDFVFYSPPDPGIDRTAYFERCWPNHEVMTEVDFIRLVECGNDVIVTYESTKSDGKRFRNTEIFTFDDGEIVKQEVYFGWDL